MILASIETNQPERIELPFYLTDPISRLFLEMFHNLSSKVVEETSFDYKIAFDEGWRFPPTQENGFLFSREFCPEDYYLLIFCQVSGTPFSMNERPFKVLNSDTSETLFVCKAVKDWLISCRGWKDVK